MTLQLAQHPEILSRVRSRDTLSPAKFVQLIRASYPELWKTLVDSLASGVETISIEPGDQLFVADDECVMQRDRLIRRRIQRREEEAREPEANGGAVPDAVADYFKEIDAPKGGIVRLHWDRGAWGQAVTNEQRTGRIEISTFEPLGSASKEIAIGGLSESQQLNILEAFATRCIPVALNGFFGVRAFLLAPNVLLLARPDLHGTERLQELLRNPTHVGSEHLLSAYASEHPEAFEFFRSMRDEAFASEDKRCERSIASLSSRLVLEIMRALAVPQIHGTVGSLLRMQYVFLQPSTVVGSTLVRAGASLQAAWDPLMQLRILAES